MVLKLFCPFANAFDSTVGFDLIAQGLFEGAAIVGVDTHFLDLAIFADFSGFYSGGGASAVNGKASYAVEFGIFADSAPIRCTFAVSRVDHRNQSQMAKKRSAILFPMCRPRCCLRLLFSRCSVVVQSNTEQRLNND